MSLANNFPSKGQSLCQPRRYKRSCARSTSEGWSSDARGVRCAARDSQPPKDGDGSIGFRVAADPQ